MGTVIMVLLTIFVSISLSTSNQKLKYRYITGQSSLITSGRILTSWENRAIDNGENGTMQNRLTSILKVKSFIILKHVKVCKLVLVSCRKLVSSCLSNKSYKIHHRIHQFRMWNQKEWEAEDHQQIDIGHIVKINTGKKIEYVRANHFRRDEWHIKKEHEERVNGWMTYRTGVRMTVDTLKGRRLNQME